MQPVDPPAVDQIVGLAGGFPSPDPVDTDAERSCERYGYLCSAADADDAQYAAAYEALRVVDAAMTTSTDAHEQLVLGLRALAGIADVGHVEVDLEHATMLAFTLDDGFKLAALTVAAGPQDDGEIAPLSSGWVAPAGWARPEIDAGQSLPVPERYLPAGGPLNPRRAAVFNPYDWASAAGIASIFRAEPQYATVDVFNGSDVNPFTIAAVGSYDAVHIITHGGGSCPAWTRDRRECTSMFGGGPASPVREAEQLAQPNQVPAAPHWLCSSGGVIRYCFDNAAFQANPNGIVFFGSCGSDFGFNQTGAGASVGWTGTTQQRVAERTAQRFWELMITDGVEFELAQELIKRGGYDSHTLTYWASLGAVNPFTSAAFQGRNLRGRDVVDVRIDGDAARGQMLHLDGRAGDGEPELAPAEGQELTVIVEGVRAGTESSAAIEIRGDGEVWPTTLNVSDGTVIAERDGYATWSVTLPAGSVTVPAVTVADLAPSRAPVELEVRVYETDGEYSAARGTVRFGAEVEFSGPLPAYSALEAALPAGAIAGNDLRVVLDTSTGTATGSMRVTMSAAGAEVGWWTLELAGTYDVASGALEGTADGASEGGAFGVMAGDQGSGPFTGAADLVAQTVTLQIGIGGSTQMYHGTVVE